jgi:hypothetical protein
MKRAALLFLVLLWLAPHALADGMLYIADRDMWYLQPEENQLAAIHYEDGMENLLVSVSPGANFTGDHAVWIFPVPAAPDKVKIDVLKGYPRMYGNNFEDSYQSAVTTSTAAQALYATFPVSVLCGAPAVVLSAYTFGMAGSISKPADVQVYDRVEKMGVTTEVVTATDAYALRNYLMTLGMDTSYYGQEILQDYIGKDYSFVVSYVSNVTAFREAGAGTAADNPYAGPSRANPIGVFVRFPAKMVYFPLRPTAVYGTRQVPVLLYVTGFTSPKLYDGIQEETEVTYFSEDHFSVSGDLAPFFDGKTEIAPLEYTKIRINAPADRFTQDLWIDPAPPADLVLRQQFRQYLFAVSATTYVLFSMAASLIAGRLLFRKKRAGTGTLLVHGLWNCGTFITMALATRRKFPQEEYGKRGPYVLCFYVVFALLLSAYAVLLSPSLTGAVLIAWVIGLLSPVISLFLLFVPLMILSDMFRPDLASLVPMLFISVIAVVLALIPVPALIWLKRWLDPEPVPAAVPCAEEGPGETR